jgi:hypothetical protein
MTGLSVAVVARIELKGRGTDVELDSVRDALKAVLGSVVTGADPKTAKTGKTTVPTKAPPITGYVGDGAVRVTEWNGVERGDIVQLKGEKGNFRFLYLHRDNHQEYVEVSGPLSSYRGQLRGRQLRSVKPERVIARKRRR